MQVITIDRRQHPGEGIMGHLADITYGSLYGGMGSVKSKPNMNSFGGISVNL